MFSPTGLYGFYCVGAEEVQFHVNRFQKLSTEGPPPIVGEALCVGDWVKRANPPILVGGHVISFDSNRGWGFIQSGNSERIFLHRSDCVEGWLPQIGGHVRFYQGYKKGRPRACWASPGG